MRIKVVSAIIYYDRNSNKNAYYYNFEECKNQRDKDIQMDLLDQE